MDSENVIDGVDESYSFEHGNANVNSCDENDNIDDQTIDGGGVAMQPDLEKRKRRLTSNVWTVFKLIPKIPGGRQKSKCKRCGKEFVAEHTSGTTAMRRHMKLCSQTTTTEVGDLLVSHSEGASSMTSSKFEQEEFRKLLVEAVITHDLPFKFVEYGKIRDLLSYLNSDVKHISRNTAKGDVLKIHGKEKKRLKSYLEAIPGRISLTSDMWTSVATDGYLCLTAHFIDAEWRLQKKVLNFCYMTPHSGVAICERIHNLLVDWNLQMKLFSFTLDNAAANTVFVDLLRDQLNLKDALFRKGDYFHVRCCAHILNLIVQDGLKVIDNCVIKIRESVKYLKGSHARKLKFLECISYVSLDSKKGLRQDVPTRWNSTFLMIKSELYYQNAFQHLQFSDSNYKFCPTSEEWEKAKKISKFLAVFYNATSLFSGTSYPTSNTFFPKVFVVEHTLKLGVEDTDQFVSSIALVMRKKFERYWANYSVLLAIACILDPRYKLQFVDFCYTELHGPGSLEFRSVKTKLFELFNEYTSKFDEGTPMTSETPSVGCSSIDVELYSQESDEIMKVFDSFESVEVGMQKSELELYLDESKLERNLKLDILSYWKTNQFRFPILSLMARDILAIPISTVASESTFSVGGRILDQFRSTLKPETVEALVCSRDWLYGIGLLGGEESLDDLTEDIMNPSSGQNLEDEVVRSQASSHA